MDLKNGVFRGKPIYILSVLLLLAVLIFSLLWAVTFGAVELDVGDVYRVILYKTLHIGDAEAHGSGSISDIVWFIRLPRLVLAVGVGAALAVSGVVMQAIVKNPLADPYILGVSSGASLGLCLFAVRDAPGQRGGKGHLHQAHPLRHRRLLHLRRRVQLHPLCGEQQ